MEKFNKDSKCVGVTGEALCKNCRRLDNYYDGRNVFIHSYANAGKCPVYLDYDEEELEDALRE